MKAYRLVACGVLIWVGCTVTAAGGLIELDPDNAEWFSPNGVVDGHGVTIRGWSANPPNPLSVWNQPAQKLYARSPYYGGVPYLGLEPSTGGLVFGGYGPADVSALTLLSAYYHFLFDNPTDFFSIDLLWPQSDWTEGAVMHAWAKGAGGVEQVVFSRVYDERPAGTYTRASLFYPGITRVRIYPHDKPGFQQRNFGLDNLNFVNTSTVSALQLKEGETIVAPDGLTLGPGDSLYGSGTIDGSLINLGATIRPGTSPGTIDVTGDYSQDQAGQLLMELGDGQHDQLHVGGTAALGGTLAISRLPGFQPVSGQMFTLLSYAAYAGRFDDIQGLDYPGGRFQPTYGPTGFYLTAIPEPSSLALMLVAATLAMGLKKRRPT